MQKLFPLICLILLTLCSGVFDAQGFIYASQVWKDGVLVKAAAAKSIAYFFVGMALYLFSLRFQQQISVISPELQSLFWFSVTLVGVAIINGKFMQWSNLDRVIALVILFGIGWLFIRTGG